MRVVGNSVVFVLVYIVGMLPTYILPYLGSNSSVLNGAIVASGAGISLTFVAHLFCLIILIAITTFRATYINKLWLIVFPVLAAAFDMLPGISNIPFVPTIMHLLAIILGVVGSNSAQLVTETNN